MSRVTIQRNKFKEKRIRDEVSFPYSRLARFDQQLVRSTLGTNRHWDNSSEN